MNHVPSLAQPLVVPEPVADEIRQCRSIDLAVTWINGAGQRFIRAAVKEAAGLAGSDVGAGERSVISWAVTDPNFVAVLDDYGARIAAQRLGVRLVGTVGVVLKLKKAGKIGEVKSHLLEIRRVGGCIGHQLFREALRLANEE